MSTDQGPFPMQTTYTWADTTAGGTLMTLRNAGGPSGFGNLAAPAMAAAMCRANRKDLAKLTARRRGGHIRTQRPTRRGAGDLVGRCAGTAAAVRAVRNSGSPLWWIPTART